MPLRHLPTDTPVAHLGLAPADASDVPAEVFGADPDRHDEAMRVLARHRPADGRAAAGAR